MTAWAPSSVTLTRPETADNANQTVDRRSHFLYETRTHTHIYVGVCVCVLQGCNCAVSPVSDPYFHLIEVQPVKKKNNPDAKILAISSWQVDKTAGTETDVVTLQTPAPSQKTPRGCRMRLLGTQVSGVTPGERRQDSMNSFGDNWSSSILRTSLLLSEL